MSYDVNGNNFMIFLLISYPLFFCRSFTFLLFSDETGDSSFEKNVVDTSLWFFKFILLLIFDNADKFKIFDAAYIVLRLNFSLICKDFSDDMKDLENGLLGVNRDAFLKLISVFDYRNENKLKQVYIY
jgi:hypothetical protein